MCPWYPCAENELFSITSFAPTHARTEQYINELSSGLVEGRLYILASRDGTTSGLGNVPLRVLGTESYVMYSSMYLSHQCRVQAVNAICKIYGLLMLRISGAYWEMQGRSRLSTRA